MTQCCNQRQMEGEKRGRDEKGEQRKGKIKVKKNTLNLFCPPRFFMNENRLPGFEGPFRVQNVFTALAAVSDLTSLSASKTAQLKL